MNFTVIIPARYGSSRFPGKPLEMIGDKAMICHVIDRARESLASRIVVATDDERIASVVKAYEAEVMLTSSNHPSGTDRLNEVAVRMSMSVDDIIVNVQGDEPLIAPENINQVALNLFDHPDCAVATLCEPINLVDEFFSPNIVKVIPDINNRALYFSRAPIPWDRDNFSVDRPDTLSKSNQALRHLGIYAYRVSALKEFVVWPMSNLENIEKLEQLRFLENGRHIHVEVASKPGAPGVDTLEDLNKVRYILETNHGN
ncbi:3-deoxy-manno-octulosonate cytidylyltransferase [Gynuella sp.]|uniref:3-deoxy-manno-octulosonate cytidylyltransferase n=1 Tax=Gynuella sp. TaxID=2969146 RepID=UPI003D0ADBA0